MTITHAQVEEYIGQLPDAAAVARIQEAAARRLGAIDKAAYEGVVPGRHARITDSLRPAFLRGLTGTVQERNRTGTRAGFILDEESTQRLRAHPLNKRYTIPDGVQYFRLPGSGIPVSCLELIED
ncbi:hypothetical protein [Streptomyces humi]